MDIKDRWQNLIGTICANADAQECWQVFFGQYEQLGIAFLKKLLAMPKRQQALLAIIQAIVSERDLKKLLERIFRG